MIPHFFVDEQDPDAREVLLDGEDTRHLVTVLRAREGAPATVADGTGSVWTARFRGLAGEVARLELEARRVVATPSPALTVVHALPKQRKLDEVVQRLTELGVHRIVPVHSARSQVHLDERKAAKAVTRWRAIALAAAKQSRRARLPIIDDVGDWTGAFNGDDPGVVCWEESATGLREVLDEQRQPAAFILAVGPEGGLTADEVAATGLPHASMGPSILRTETAALVAAAAVSYHFGLMEPA